MGFLQIVAKYPGEQYQAHLGLLLFHLHDGRAFSGSWKHTSSPFRAVWICLNAVHKNHD